jgi:twitching motility protein PilT
MSHSAPAPSGPPAAAPSIDDLIKKMSVETHDLEVDKFFRALVKFEGSDLHMKVGRPPMIRVRNELRPLNHPNIERI